MPLDRAVYRYQHRHGCSLLRENSHSNPHHLLHDNYSSDGTFESVVRACGELVR
ncbi:hypothetical protein M3J09_009887 [Ascochyta lentis]